MNPAVIVALLNAVLPLIPQIPQLIAGIKTAIELVTSGVDPTAAQQAQIDAALEAAHAQLQAAGTPV